MSLVMFCILTMKRTHPTFGTWQVSRLTPSRVHHQRTQAIIHYSYGKARRKHCSLC
jgi:cytochrome oxidase assembly protein ShyY1